MAAKSFRKKKTASRKIIHRSFRPSYKASPFFHLATFSLLLVFLGIILYFLPLVKQNSSDFLNNILSTNWLNGTDAFIRNDNVWVHSGRTEKQLTNNVPLAQIPYNSKIPRVYLSNPQVSPDGKMIAFVKIAADYSNINRLYVVDINGSNMNLLTDKVNTYNTMIAWARDSKSIYYTFSSPAHIAMLGDRATIHSISPLTKEDKYVGNYLLSGKPCGGGSDDPADGLMRRESGLSGGGETENISSFQASPSYLLHNIDCGGHEVGLLNLQTHQESTLSKNVNEATFSPDGTRVAAAGITSKKIMIFDANTNSILQIIPVLETPTNLLWSTDGKNIYYVSVKLLKTTPVPHAGSATIGQLHSFIHKVPLDSQKDAVLAEINAHNIRLITVINSKIFVSLINNSSLALSSGEPVLSSRTDFSEIDLKNGSLQTIIENAQQSSYLPN